MEKNTELFYSNNDKLGTEYLAKMEIDLPPRIFNILKESNASTEEQFFKELEEIIFEHTSYYLFPNELCSFYPKVIEHKATKNFTCFLSGAEIVPGESYYRYRPIIENLQTNKVYTITQTIIASIDYIDCFPQTLFEFELWAQNIDQAEYHQNEKVDFYLLSSLAGSNCLYLKELKKNSDKKRKRHITKEIKELEKLRLELVKIKTMALNPENTAKKLIKIEKRIKQLKNK